MFPDELIYEFRVKSINYIIAQEALIINSWKTQINSEHEKNNQ